MVNTYRFTCADCTLAALILVFTISSKRHGRGPEDAIRNVCYVVLLYQHEPLGERDCHSSAREATSKHMHARQGTAQLL